MTNFSSDNPLLELYYLESDESCLKMIKVLSEKNLKFVRKDITNLIHLQKLQLITGSRKIPCLFVNGNPISDVNEILCWINENDNCPRPLS